MSSSRHAVCMSLSYLSNTQIFHWLFLKTQTFPYFLKGYTEVVVVNGVGINNKRFLPWHTQAASV